jgi:homoserine O-acetyltransferase
MMEALITRVKRGRFVLVPVSAETRGHGTHSRPQVFGPHLALFLKEIAR